MKFLKKNKKIVILISVGVLLILSGILSWNLYFSKFKIFKDNEKLFLETVERYYSMNSNYLPEKNGTREMTLQKLYEGHHITDLCVPKTKKLCDSNSWVRVYQDENGKFSYTTYLKCGKFESNVDHTGPEITLNGESEITLALGSTYQEPGVSKVYDKVDGNLNTSDVVIDSSSLDINKAGNYKITYTIRDKSYNKTVVTRTVIVAKNLTNVVKDATDESNYYKGLDPNNYLLFSGMLFRIVGVNSDGSVKIVTQNSIANSNFGTEETTFDNSNIKEWLNNYFYSKIHDTSYLKEDSSWCIDSISDINTTSNNCVSYSTSPVGLLSVSDYNLSKDATGTYLNTITEYWLINRESNRFGYIHLLLKETGINTNDGTDISGVKPSLILKNDLYILSGNGSINNPYRLGDYKEASNNDLLNTRLIGEHVSYFGMSFRISDIDKDGNIRLTSTGYLKNNTTGNFIYSSYENEDKILKFDPSKEGNIAYQLNHQHLDFIDDSLIISHEFLLPTYEANKKYSEYLTSKFKTKVSIPASYEMFSATNEQMTGQASYWLLDNVDDNHAFMINSSNGKTFTIDSGSLYNSNGFKIQFYVSKNTKIKSGKGTSLNPYIIK